MALLLSVLGLALVGLFVAQYAVGLLLRVKNVFRPLIAALETFTKLDQRLYSKLTADRVMPWLLIIFAPLAVLAFASYWLLIPYAAGFLIGCLLLRGKTGPSQDNQTLFFYNYRIYVENNLAIRNHPSYGPLMQYKRRSLVEKTLEAEQRKHQQEQNSSK